MIASPSFAPKPPVGQARLAGKIALVTGAGSGIGRGCAEMFARQGAQLIGCDRDPAAAEATRAALTAEGLAIELHHPVDLTDEAAVSALVSAIMTRHGRIDVLVNAAAFAVFAPIETMSLADWRATLAGELDLVFLACRAVWPHMVRGGGGVILNFASANAYVALEGSAALAHCAGKGGVLSMTRQLAMEGAPHGIRANTISPGLIVTGATEKALARPGFLDAVMRKSMVKRLGLPSDIAWCATYLASDEASFVTGADFAIDGGARAW